MNMEPLGMVNSYTLLQKWLAIIHYIEVLFPIKPYLDTIIKTFVQVFDWDNKSISVWLLKTSFDGTLLYMSLVYK